MCVFLNLLVCCATLSVAQPLVRVVVVTTNATPPAFLQELRGDDPKTIQRVAEREGFEAFQKEDAWYLIPRTLLSQSQIARANRILSHLLERFSDEEAPTSFTLDSLPPTIAEEMRLVLGDIANRLDSGDRFKLNVNIHLRGRLKNETTFYIPFVARATGDKVVWSTTNWRDASSSSGQGTVSVPTETFLRQFGIRVEWGLLCFHYNSRIDGSHLKTAADVITDYDAAQREAIQQTIRSLQERLMRNAPVPIGTVSVGELPSDVQESLAKYLQEQYNATLADLSEVELLPEVFISVPLKSHYISFPIKYLSEMRPKVIQN